MLFASLHILSLPTSVTLLTRSDSSQPKFKMEIGISMEQGTVKWFNDAKVCAMFGLLL